MHSEVLTFERQRYEGQGCKKHGGSTSSVPSSRAKHFHRQQRYKAESDSDSDVVLVFDPEGNAEEGATTAQLKLAKQRQEKATFARQGRQPEDDDDVQMVAEVGKDAGRHLPHCRVDCLCHPFIMGVALANRQHCPQCFCFVCDCRASQCAFWGTGARAEDHANGRTVSYWLKLRTAARAGDTAQVKAAYRTATAPQHPDTAPAGAAAAAAHMAPGSSKSKRSASKDAKTSGGTSGSGSRDHGKGSGRKAGAEGLAAAAVAVAVAARPKAAVAAPQLAAAVLNPVSSAGLRLAAAAAVAKQELQAKRLAALSKKKTSEMPVLPSPRTVAAKQLPGGTARERSGVPPIRREAGAEAGAGARARAGAREAAGAGAGAEAGARGAAVAGLEVARAETETRKSSRSWLKRVVAKLDAMEKRQKV